MMNCRHLLGFVTSSNLLSFQVQLVIKPTRSKEKKYPFPKNQVTPSIMGWTVKPMPFVQEKTRCKEIGSVAINI